MNIQINTIWIFFNTAPPAPSFFGGYTPGGAAAPAAPLLSVVMIKLFN